MKHFIFFALLIVSALFQGCLSAGCVDTSVPTTKGGPAIPDTVIAEKEASFAGTCPSSIVYRNRSMAYVKISVNSGNEFPATVFVTAVSTSTLETRVYKLTVSATDNNNTVYRLNLTQGTDQYRLYVQTNITGGGIQFCEFGFNKSHSAGIGAANGYQRIYYNGHYPPYQLSSDYVCAPWCTVKAVFSCEASTPTTVFHLGEFTSTNDERRSQYAWLKFPGQSGPQEKEVFYYPLTEGTFKLYLQWDPPAASNIQSGQITPFLCNGSTTDLTPLTAAGFTTPHQYFETFPGVTFSISPGCGFSPQ